MECAVHVRDESSGRWQHHVDVARCSADRLSASAQCVVWCRVPAGGSAWQADGSLAARIEYRSARSCCDVKVSIDVTPL